MKSSITNYQLSINSSPFQISKLHLLITNRWQPIIRVLVIGLLFLIIPRSLAQSAVSPTEAMVVGNQHYEAGQYAEAIEVYKSIVEAGIHDSALYYNLGNAYYKHGDLGWAILYYRRAHHLEPRDPDVRNNLVVARSQTLDQLEAEEGILTNFVQIAEAWLTLSEASILALILWLFIGLFALVAILSERLRRFSLWAIFVVAVFLVLGLISMANRYYLEQTSPPAVIVAQEVDVTSGPGDAEQYLVEFNLHAGAEVRLLESRPGWRRITLPGDDFQGWVPAEAVIQVYDTQ